jgi:hypothetical protein
MTNLIKIRMLDGRCTYKQDSQECWLPNYGNDFCQEKTLRIAICEQSVIRYDHNATPHIQIYYCL